MTAGLLLADREPAAAESARSDGAASAALTVGARVVPFARVRVVRQEAVLELTPADVERGHLDLENAASLVVRTNSPSGYFLDFEISSDMIRGVEILGLPDRPSLYSPRGRVLRPTTGPVQETLEIGFRFLLSERAEPGVHPWPVGISVSAR